jgi:hypothetical protein
MGLSAACCGLRSGRDHASAKPTLRLTTRAPASIASISAVLNSSTVALGRPRFSGIAAPFGKIGRTSSVQSGQMPRTAAFALRVEDAGDADTMRAGDAVRFGAGGGLGPGEHADVFGRQFRMVEGDRTVDQRHRNIRYTDRKVHKRREADKAQRSVRISTCIGAAGDVPPVECHSA